LLSSNIAYSQIVLTPEDNEAKKIIIGNVSAAVDHLYSEYDLLLGSKKLDNSTFVIYNITDSPEPPLLNKPPVIQINSISVLVNETAVLKAVITDSDGIVKSVSWEQKSGPRVEFTPTATNLTFMPAQVENYGFLVTAIDDDNASSTESAIVRVTNTPPPPEVCGNSIDDDGDGEIDEDCPITPPTKTKADFAGDLFGTSVINAMKARNATWNVALGDLGYWENKDDFKSNFISKWKTLKNDKCVIGNHDKRFDLYETARTFCGEQWKEKIAGGTTLLIGANTEGNLEDQLEDIMRYVRNATLMKNVKNVVLLTHRPCEVPSDDSHHQPRNAEKNFCNNLDTKIRELGIKMYHISAHNNEIAKSNDGLSYLSGGGGREDHRDCGGNDSNTWDFCRTKNGILEFEINNDTGEILAKFFSTNGDVIN
jgi:hypothetical protein